MTTRTTEVAATEAGAGEIQTSVAALGVGLAVASTGFLAVAEDAREPHGPLPIDARVLRIAVAHRTPAIVSAAKVITHLGDPTVLVLVALAAGALLWRSRRRILDAIVPLVALLGASATETVIKQVVGRPRPPVRFHLIHETDASFPSGHTTGTAALAVALALVVAAGRPGRITQIGLLVAAGLVATAVGASRIVLGVHWTSDVVAGLCLGTAWALGTVGTARLGSARAAAPSATTP